MGGDRRRRHHEERYYFDSAPEITDAEFDALFRVERYLENLDGVFERLEKLPVEEA